MERSEIRGRSRRALIRPLCYDICMLKLLDRITINPQICSGRPCINGTRIWVSLILDLLADGVTEDQIRADYPQLAHEDILAAIAYGAEAARAGDSRFDRRSSL